MTAVLPVRSVLADAADYRAGSLVVSEGRILSRCAAPADAPDDWFVIPGFRNAHAHLDLSEVTGVRRADRGFAAWVLDLIRARPFDPAFLARGAAHGARLLLASGTTAVGDIDSSGAAAPAVAASGLRGVSFREFLGRATEADTNAAALAWRGADVAGNARDSRGVSPHAPYSTAPSIYRALVATARASGMRLSTHAAETLAEERYLAEGGGEFRELLALLGARGPFDSPPGLTPLRYLDSLGALYPGVVLAHANWPRDGEIELLRERGAGVAFCPRSHAFFGHPRHPVREYRAAGIDVALGTDSLASNSSLSMPDEMAFLRAARPDLAAADVFDMATRGGARLLEGTEGALTPGAAADFAICSAAGGLPASLPDALDRVTGGGVTIVATVVSGELCFASDPAVRELLPLTRRGEELSTPAFPDRAASRQAGDRMGSAPPAPGGA